MAARIKASLSMQKDLLDQADALARDLDLPRSRLFELAVAQFIRTYPAPLDSETTGPRPEGRPAINQGDIYWLRVEGVEGGAPGIPHPHVVVQDNVFNHSRIDTVVVCALTSNLKRASLPGNVLLEAGEANLPRSSIVEVSKVSAVDKTRLGEYIGSLSEARIEQILAGMRFLQRAFLPR
jgi:mRNA interferase MazF